MQPKSYRFLINIIYVLTTYMCHRFPGFPITLAAVTGNHNVFAPVPCPDLTYLLATSTWGPSLFHWISS